jgi:hypothetical protein
MKKLILATAFSLFTTFGFAQSVVLQPVNSIVESQFDGEIIENLEVDCRGLTHSNFRQACVMISHANVTVKNVKILHDKTLHGLRCNWGQASGLRVDGVEVIHTGVPTIDTGGNINDAWTATNGRHNIIIEGCNDVIVSNVRLEGAATGIFALDSTNVTMRFVQGKNMRGPFPGGQIVQCNKTPGCVLEDFSIWSDPDPVKSWPEDNISIYQSPNSVVERGVIDGNNSSHGVGVMFEFSDGGFSNAVDAVRMANGAFSAWGSDNVAFLDTRFRDLICTDQGRGLPASGGQGWVFASGSLNGSVTDSTYWNWCHDWSWVSGTSSATFDNVVEEEFMARPLLSLVMAWEDNNPPPPPPPDNEVPTVSFLQPLQGDTFPEFVNLEVEVSASDTDGNVDRVELYLDGVFVRSELVVPYLWNCGSDAVLCNMASKGYQLTAKVFDNEGAEGGATVDIVVEASDPPPPPPPPPSDDTVKPVVTLSTAGQVRVGDTVSVSYGASDNEGVVSGELVINNDIVVPFNSDGNFNVNWIVTEPTGNLPVTVWAVDAAGNVGVVSGVVSVCNAKGRCK